MHTKACFTGSIQSLLLILAPTFLSQRLLAEEKVAPPTDESVPIVLTIAAAEELALKQNPDLRIKSNDMENAHLASENAFSYFYPDIALFAGYGYTNPPPGMKKELLPGVPLDLSIGRLNSYTYGVQMRYILFAGGKRWDGYQAAKLGAEAERLLYASERRNAIYKTRKVFLYGLLAREAMRLAGEANDRSKDRLKNSQARLSQGTISSLEFLRVKTESADMELLFRESENKYRMALDAVRMTLSIPEVRDIELSGSLALGGQQLALLEESPGMQKRLEDLDGVQIARLREKQAKIAVELEKDDFYPTLSASLNYNRSNPYLSQPIYGNNVAFQVAATFPVFEGGRSYNEYKIAQKRSESATIVAGKVHRELAAYSRSLEDRRITLQRSLSVRSEAMNTARKALSAAEVGWRNGSATYTDLRESELIRMRMEIEYYRAIVETMDCYAEEERLTGDENGQFKKSLETMGNNDARNASQE